MQCNNAILNKLSNLASKLFINRRGSYEMKLAHYLLVYKNKTKQKQHKLNRILKYVHIHVFASLMT